MELTFDATKNAANLAKHGVSLAEACWLEWGSAVIWQDMRYDYGELRQSALALMAGRVFFVAFVGRAEERRIITLRKANMREVKRYAAND